MNALPGWLETLRSHLPRWLATLQDPSGVGRYRWATEAHEPYDLASSTGACAVRFTLSQPPQGEEAEAWCTYLAGLQREEDGLLVDPALERHFRHRGDRPYEEAFYQARLPISRNALFCVLAMGGRPRYPLRGGIVAESPQEMTRYIEGLHWDNPWGAGSWAGAAIACQVFNQRVHGEDAQDSARAQSMIDAGIDWLLANQDPKNGAWPKDSPAEPHRLVNGIFKVWTQLLPLTSMPVQYPEAAIDLCLEALATDPNLANNPDACSLYDVALVMAIALEHTDHRREEIAAPARAAIDRVQPMVRADGALSYGPEQTGARGNWDLAPPRDQGDIGGTQLNARALALLAELGGLNNDLCWTPETQWRKMAGRQD